MKKNAILAALVVLVAACSDNSSSTSGSVALKATAVSTTGKTSLTAKTTVGATVVITDFKVNIGNIKFETDVEDVRHSQDPTHEDVKLMGPFLLDLLDANAPLSQMITTVDIPEAKYEEIKFMFKKSAAAGEMLDKTYLIKGTINGKDFSIWSDKDVELEMDFLDPSQDFTVNAGTSTLNIKLQLDAILAKVVSLANQGLLLDTDNDGVIEMSTNNDDGHLSIGDDFKKLLEKDCHLDDKD